MRYVHMFLDSVALSMIGVGVGLSIFAFSLSVDPVNVVDYVPNSLFVSGFIASVLVMFVYLFIQSLQSRTDS